ncbi:MAG: hypothetical protein WCJ35_24930 [Planctomycetota bacterium]
MKGFVVVLFCLSCVFCLSGCGGYTLEGTWKVNPLVEVEFRSDGSILTLGQKVKDWTWHGDCICLKADIKKMRAARIEWLILFRDSMIESTYGKKVDKESKEYARLTKSFDEQLEELKHGQLEDLKNGKVMEGMEGCYHFPLATGVDRKDISESADKVEVKIHWVDTDHFDIGSTSFTRVKLPK